VFPNDIACANDDPRIRTALQALIDSDPTLAVAAVARDSAQAIALARLHHPTVAIVDVRMPGTGPDAVRGIRQHSPETGILAYSAHDTREAVDAMIQAGADDYLLKSTSVPQILAAIHRLADTEPHGS